mgnify:CR=1 FL=1
MGKNNRALAPNVLGGPAFDVIGVHPNIATETTL